MSPDSEEHELVEQLQQQWQQRGSVEGRSDVRHESVY